MGKLRIKERERKGREKKWEGWRGRMKEEDEGKERRKKAGKGESEGDERRERRKVERLEETERKKCTLLYTFYDLFIYLCIYYFYTLPITSVSYPGYVV